MIAPRLFLVASPATFLVLLALGLPAGCQHAPPAAGQSSFAFVEPPPEPAGKTRTASDVQLLPPQQFVAARPSLPLATPRHPARALAAHAGAAIVTVRITIAADGQVSDIAQSFAAVSLPGPFAPDFRAAVDEAVARWRFTPAHLQDFETVTEKGFAYPRVAHDENVAVQADVKFTFTATGGVSLGPTPAEAAR